MNINSRDTKANRYRRIQISESNASDKNLKKNISGLCDMTAESSFKLLIEMSSKMSSQRKEANMKLK